MTDKTKEYDFHEEHHTDLLTVNMGPSHPATHGTVKFLISLDGETIEKLDVEVGYLHRGFEKECEAQAWNGVFPYTDRLDYTASVLNNVGYALAVERLIGIETPERCQYIRVIMSEMARMSGHYTNLAAGALELGALTAFIYLSKRVSFCGILSNRFVAQGLPITTSGLVALPPTFRLILKRTLKKSFRKTGSFMMILQNFF